MARERARALARTNKHTYTPAGLSARDQLVADAATYTTNT